MQKELTMNALLLVRIFPIYVYTLPTQAMTEKDSRDLDVFTRQALIGGAKVPVLWGLLGNVGTTLQT